MTRWFAFLALAVIAGSVAHAQVTYYTGERMVGFCEANAETSAGRADVSACRGFLAAVNDTHATVSDWEKLKPYVCVPPGTSVAALRQVFLNYMQIHTEDWGKAASSLALNAFNEQWPCPVD